MLSQALGRLSRCALVHVAYPCGLWRRLAHGSTPAEVYVERLEGEDTGVSLLTMDRPTRKNAIGRAFLDALASCVDELRNDRSTRVVILRSAVGGAFCSGADLKERTEMSQPEVASFVRRLRTTFTDLETLPHPTIAVMEGPALGGGLELALACDLRVAAPKARIGLPEASLAIIPGAGGTQRLPRLLGRARAKELIFTARVLDGEKAKEYGIVEHIGSFEDALQLARQILPQGPVALRMAKLAIDRGMEVDLSSGLFVEEACYAQVIPTQDRLEGLLAFREKRRPVFRGE